MMTLIEYGFVDVICTLKLVHRTGCSSKTLRAVDEGRMSSAWIPPRKTALVNCVSPESGLRVNDNEYVLLLASSTISVFISRRLRLSFLHEHLQKVVAQ